jgi:GntR family transcriptional regulator
MSRRSLTNQMHDELLAELRTGVFAPGTKLPNEQQLADRFDVSRATVREAVGSLVQAGYVVRRHGSGTYVTQSFPRHHALDSTVSYTAMIRAAGMEPGELVIERVTRMPEATEARRLRLARTDRVVAIDRVRTADGRRVIYSRDRIPERLLASVAEAPLDASLYDVLREAGAVVQSARATLVPVVADEIVAAHLAVAPGSPLLQIDEVDLDASGQPVMLSLEWHVPDVFELHLNRRAATS